MKNSHPAQLPSMGRRNMVDREQMDNRKQALSAATKRPVFSAYHIARAWRLVYTCLNLGARMG